MLCWQCQAAQYTRKADVALSVRQPWAWLIVNGWKNIENRDWPTKRTGRVWIHASGSMTQADYCAARLFICGFDWGPGLLSRMPAAGDLVRGALVGSVTILGCVTAHSSDWFTGPYGFVVDDAEACAPRPMRGALGFFKVQAEA